jgi:2-polyprenyl-3-methyl-5-hydroxy-6-metoxy-1,4-benzoquinol methylase
MKSKYKKENDLVEHYEAHPKYYSPVKNESYFFNCLKRFNIDIESTNHILDIGCGDGRISKYIPEHIKYTGVDYSPTRIKIANESNDKSNHNFVYNCAREFVFSAEPQKYDLITAFEFLEHIVNPKELIEELLNKQNCTIIGTVPINMPYKAHLSVWKNEKELKEDLNPDSFFIEKCHFNCCWSSLKT